MGIDIVSFTVGLTGLIGALGLCCKELHMHRVRSGCCDIQFSTPRGSIEPEVSITVPPPVVRAVIEDLRTELREIIQNSRDSNIVPLV